MLFKSGHNLLQETQNFINSEEKITLFSAYLRLDQLKELNEKKNINRIVVRWEVKDLCLGVSDLDLFEYCEANKIILYRNTRLHLKAFWNGGNRLSYGSANVTGRGIGEKGQFNYELNGYTDQLSFSDRYYLDTVINESEYVNSKLFEELSALVTEVVLPVLKYPKRPSQRIEKDYFLISQLPMFASPKDLYDATRENNFYSLNNLDQACVSHDIALYNLDLNLDRNSFYAHLKERFNKHQFIAALKNEIKSSRRMSLRYGAVVRWIQHNTTTVPTPRSWELKEEEVVNILYSWICYFDSDFTWNVPGSRSQVIYYKKGKRGDY